MHGERGELKAWPAECEQILKKGKATKVTKRRGVGRFLGLMT